MRTVFRSSVDWWIAAILAGAPLFVVGLGFFTLAQSITAGVIQIVVGLLIGGLIAAFSVPCVYSINARGVGIRCGMLAEEIPFSEIRQAEKSCSAWSAPALSLKRVKLTLTNESRLISPEDREEFIEAVRTRIHSSRAV